MRPKFFTLAPLCVALLGSAAAGLARAQERVPDGALAVSQREQAIAYEHGEGVARDPMRAAVLYCNSARMGDMVAQYNLGWMYAHGRGVARDDATAAFFFHAAARCSTLAATGRLPVDCTAQNSGAGAEDGAQIPD